MNHLIEMGQVFARRIVRTAAAFAVLSTVATAASAQQFTIGAYHLQSSVRVSLTQYDYTYTADVSNSGGLPRMSLARSPAALPIPSS